PREHREPKLAVPEERAPVDRDRRGDGELGGSELRRELVLLGDLLVAPAARPVELEDEQAGRRLELVHPILVAVEREQPPDPLEAHGLGRIEHGLRGEPGERRRVRHGSAACFVYHGEFGPRAPDTGASLLMANGSLLITGGAGYIGSHVLHELRTRGEQVVALDDLSRGFRRAVLDAPLVVADVGDRHAVREALSSHRVETVLHFAAHTIVPESVRRPLKYYGNNTCATRSLIECCIEAGVRHFVFSS